MAGVREESSWDSWQLVYHPTSAPTEVSICAHMSASVCREVYYTTSSATSLILDWPKRLFGFFCYSLCKRPNKLIDQPNKSILHKFQIYAWMQFVPPAILPFFLFFFKLLSIAFLYRQLRNTSKSEENKSTAQSLKLMTKDIYLHEKNSTIYC